jgi:hypothetical protein
MYVQLGSRAEMMHPVSFIDTGLLGNCINLGMLGPGHPGCILS